MIFDCDGVLVDSEMITNRVFARMLAELGITMTLDDLFERFVGRSMTHCRTLIAELLQRPVPDAFLADFRARTTAALQAELEAVAGIEGVLDALTAAGVPFCVASSGSHEKMRLTLGITGLLPRFEGRMFSVTEVPHAKPAPDVFLFAARRCGADPSACCVVEDTPTGVEAGVAAGMRVYGYCGLTPASRLTHAGAHVVFDEMKRLPALLLGA